MAPAKDRVWSRREIEGLIADGRKIIILRDQVLSVGAWIPYHPGGDKSILHLVGRNGIDEVTALHSDGARTQMQRFVIGRIQGQWQNFLPPIQGGVFRPLPSKGTDEENAASAQSTESGDACLGLMREPTPRSPMLDARGGGHRARLRFSAGSSESASQTSSMSSGPPSPAPVSASTFESAEASIAHAISSDLSLYPGLDQMSQHEVATKYRELDETLRAKGLYQCAYRNYAVEFLRYFLLLVLFRSFLRYSYFTLSSICLGFLWHLLAFSVHDAGHISITHDFHTDTCIGIFIANFLGGLSVGWWKRNHNVHHIATNSPEHDPDIQHMPFFAISSRFFSSLHSTYYDRDMKLDSAARFFIKWQHYLYYPILLLGRFNLYRLAWLYLLDPRQSPRKGPAWWHRYLEMSGQLIFWYWFGYRTLYLSVPTWSARLSFLFVSHAVTAPLHVQLTLSHFAMSSADVGVQESFAQKMVRTTMDVECPGWLDFIHGGLNFQVVHHLFPRLPRHNLRQAQPLVKEFCDKVGIPYIKFSFTRGNQEVIGRLGEVAQQLQVLEECQKIAAKELVERCYNH
ncbi:Fatty acid/sphingolipid desaturase [Akanthomyces lecanii RCEF 1005]|uniref:Delta 8-(E)-sphingolipid desaturase n=1 Tax=Akanthomyces lecanii RCEF 1005 TaxID=1081108 RepID=A0A168DSK7_CORDF|nr:Fatty acid/sphingolipid desaturase [Akanthomyces lecanii RCEF 1005]